jgi:hypothetical protein
MSQLSPSLQAVLELFQGPLAELRFADVDAAVLAELAANVESAASAVAEQEARLTELRQSLIDRQDALLLLAQRALAYARVYAEPDPALTEQLARITLPKASKPRKANVKAAGAEPVVPESESSTPQELAAAEVTTALPTEEASEPHFEAAASEANGAEAAAPRTAKRRSRQARDEAQSRPV